MHPWDFTLMLHKQWIFCDQNWYDCIRDWHIEFTRVKNIKKRHQIPNHITFQSMVCVTPTLVTDDLLLISHCILTQHMLDSYPLCQRKSVPPWAKPQRGWGHTLFAGPTTPLYLGSWSPRRGCDYWLFFFFSEFGASFKWSQFLYTKGYVYHPSDHHTRMDPTCMVIMELYPLHHLVVS